MEESTLMSIRLDSGVTKQLTFNSSNDHSPSRLPTGDISPFGGCYLMHLAAIKDELFICLICGRLKKFSLPLEFIIRLGLNSLGQVGYRFSATCCRSSSWISARAATVALRSTPFKSSQVSLHCIRFWWLSISREHMLGERMANGCSLRYSTAWQKTMLRVLISTSSFCISRHFL